MRKAGYFSMSSAITLAVVAWSTAAQAQDSDVDAAATEALVGAAAGAVADASADAPADADAPGQDDTTSADTAPVDDTAIVVTATVATSAGNRPAASSGAVPTDATNRVPLAGSIIVIVSMHTGVVAGSSRSLG